MCAASRAYPPFCLEFPDFPPDRLGQLRLSRHGEGLAGVELNGLDRGEWCGQKLFEIGAKIFCLAQKVIFQMAEVAIWNYL